MITKDLVIRAVKETNEIIGLEPKLDESDKLTDLVSVLRYISKNKDDNGEYFIQPGDPFSNEIKKLFDKLSTITDEELQEQLPDDDYSTGDSLPEQIGSAVKLKELKDICKANDEFISLRSDLGIYSKVEMLRDKMIETLTLGKIDSKEEDPAIEEEEVPEDVPETIPEEEFVGEDLKVFPRFHAACPALSEEELKDLEALILKDGKILQPILTWGGYIVDGHNRYDIAMKHSIPFPVMEMEFESEDAVVIWIKENAISQRNLSDYARYELIKDIKGILKGEAKKRMAHGKTAPGKKMRDEDKEEAKGTRKQLAEISGLSEGQIAKIETINKVVDEDTKEQLRKGKTTVGKVHKEITKKDTPLTDKEKFDIAANDLEKWVVKYSDDEIFDQYTAMVADIIRQMREELPF